MRNLLRLSDVLVQPPECRPFENWLLYKYSVAVQGHAFMGARLLTKEALAARFADVESECDFAGLLSKLNGFFAVVLVRGATVLAAVDRVRSRPVFFHNSMPRLASNAEDLVPGLDLDPQQARFMRRTGYCLGGKTLDIRVGQVEAGSYVTWSPEQGGWRTVAYFSHCRKAVEASDETFGAMFLDTLSETFNRLTQYLDGRTALIPLSGGADSRLVLAGLLNQGYRRVRCFTYGRPDSYETKIARQVTQRAKVPWDFVSYTTDVFRNALAYGEFVGYRRNAGRYSAVPHWQELPATVVLRDSVNLPPDIVVVPGFSADLLAGSYLPSSYGRRSMQAIVRRGLGKYVEDVHCYLNKHLPSGGMAEYLMADNPGWKDVQDQDEFVALHEEWMVRNKVSKFVINGIRAYEAVGWDWAMPLWDSEFMEFWYRVPNRLRVGRRFYYQQLGTAVFPKFDLSVDPPAQWRRSGSAQALGRVLPRRAVIAAKRGLDMVTGTATHDFNGFEEFSRAVVSQLPPGAGTVGESVHQAMVDDYLVYCRPELGGRGGGK